MPKKREKDTKDGFSLIELAIVLAVAGLVLGAIWAAGSAVSSRQKIQKGVETITLVADQVRAYISSNPARTSVAEIDDLDEQIAAGFFPADIVDGATTRSDWDGNVQVRFMRHNSTVVGFTVAISMSDNFDARVREEACAGVVTALPASGKAAGNDPTAAAAVPLPSVYPLPTGHSFPGPSPVYAYVRKGSWVNVTGRAGPQVGDSGNDSCTGVAFFFRL